MLELGQEVVGDPGVLLTLVLVAKRDCVAGRDKLLSEEDISSIIK